MARERSMPCVGTPRCARGSDPASSHTDLERMPFSGELGQKVACGLDVLGSKLRTRRVALVVVVDRRDALVEMAMLYQRCECTTRVCRQGIAVLRSIGSQLRRPV